MTRTAISTFNYVRDSFRVRLYKTELINRRGPWKSAQIPDFHMLLGKASPKTLGFPTVPTMPTAGPILRFALIFR